MYVRMYMQHPASPPDPISGSGLDITCTIMRRHNLYDHSSYGSRVLKKNEKTLESTEEKEAEMSCCSLVLVLIL